MLTTKIGKREDSQASAVENELNAQGSRAWLLYFLGGILAIGGYYLLPSPSMQDIFTILVDASVVAAIATGIFMYRPSRSLPWYLFFRDGSPTHRRRNLDGI